MRFITFIANCFFEIACLTAFTVAVFKAVTAGNGAAACVRSITV